MGRTWTTQEDKIITRFVMSHGHQWEALAAKLPNHTAAQIQARWEKCLNPILVKGPFTKDEDEMICEFVKTHGPQNWPLISKVLPDRSPKQCRERWFNHLDPSVSKHSWTPQEDRIIFESYQKFGGKWSQIAKLLPGRTDNAVKNRWNSSLSKRAHHGTTDSEVLAPCTKQSKTKPSSTAPEGAVFSAGALSILEELQDIMTGLDEPPKQDGDTTKAPNNDTNKTTHDDIFDDDSIQWMTNMA